MYVFLMAFLPFGVSNYNPNHSYTWEFLLEIGKILLLTLALAALLELWLKPWLVKRPTLKNVLLWNALLLLVLGVGDFLLYNWLGNWHDFSWASAVEFVLNCAAVFIFPLVGIFFYFRFRSLSTAYRQMQVQWQTDPNPDRLIHFRGQGSNDQLSVAASDFRFAQAQDNYVALHYMRAGQLKTELIRSPLTELLDQAGSEDLARCHRSFVVNLRQVRSYSGGNPLLLFLDGVAEPVRVSRSYREAILGRLHPAALQP